MAIELGELRQQLKNDLGHSLDELLVKNENKWDEYFIIVYSFWDPEVANVLRSRIYVAGHPGKPMMGTMCFHVDNVKCTIKQIWNKPMDGPQWEKENLLSNDGVDKIGEEAVGSGIALHN